MQRLAVFLLVATALAGCSTSGEPGSFEVRILYDDRSTFYTGDAVALQAAAPGQAIVRWEWDFGDGTGGEGQAVEHVFSQAGDLLVRVRATRDDGAQAVGQAVITVQDLFGSSPRPGPTPSGPPPTSGDASGIVNLSLAGEEPVAGEPFKLRLDGPAFLGAGTITIWRDGVATAHAFDGLPAAIDMDPAEAGPQRMAWLAEIDGEAHSGAAVFDVWGRPMEFGEPAADQWLRPGVQTVANSAQCTTNFLFHYKWYRFFIGSAAHCVDGADINDVCQDGPTAKIGDKQTVSAHDGRSVTTTLAYSSWITMDEKGGGNCSANDFALYELDAKGQAVMHPKSLFFGGPTALAPMDGYGMGTTLYGYGASQLHGNVGVAYPGQDVVNSKRGPSLGVTEGGYYQQMYFAIPGIPGDSGGPAFGPGGEALGAASVIYYAPFAGSNSYTIIPKALAYMEEKEGWAPELVTYDVWSVTGA